MGVLRGVARDKDPFLLSDLFQFQKFILGAMVPILLLVLPSLSLGQNQCGPFTTKDKPGPFYEANAPKEKELAPRKELSDPRQFVILEGTIRGRDCQGVSGAIVEVWYAGREPTCGKMEFWPCYNAGKMGYTKPGKNSEVWYRGKVKADRQGRYSFKATYPHVYEGRAILHYHYKVTSGSGNRAKEFITQAYFKDKVPRGLEDEVQGKDQFAKVQQIPEGRRITYNIRLDA